MGTPHDWHRRPMPRLLTIDIERRSEVFSAEHAWHEIR